MFVWLILQVLFSCAREQDLEHFIVLLCVFFTQVYKPGFQGVLVPDVPVPGKRLWSHKRVHCPELLPAAKWFPNGLRYFVLANLNRPCLATVDMGSRPIRVRSTIAPCIAVTVLSHLPGLVVLLSVFSVLCH